MLKKGAIVLFTLAVVPNPLFDVAGIAAGGIGYPIKRFLVVVGLGKIIRGVYIAFICHHGLHFFHVGL